MDILILILIEVIKSVGLFYLSTIILSSFMAGTLFHKFFKDLAYEGKKVKLKEDKFKMTFNFTFAFGDKVKDVNFNLSDMIMFLGINVITFFRVSLHYEDFKENLKVSLEDDIVPLTEKEKNKYSKFPLLMTYFNSLKEKTYTRYYQNKYIIDLKVINEMGESIISCLLKDEDIKVVNVTGPLKDLSKKEIENIAYLGIGNIIVEEIDKAHSEEELINSILNRKEFIYDLTKNEDFKQEEDLYYYYLPDSEIYWRYTPNYEDIEIILVKGEAEKLSVGEQKDLVIEGIRQVYAEKIKENNVHEDDEILTRKRKKEN